MRAEDAERSEPPDPGDSPYVVEDGIAPPEEAPAAPPPPTARLSLFRLGGTLFGVDSNHCREVAAIDAHTSVPGAPEYLIGVANLRGEILPLLEIDRILDQPGTHRRDRHAAAEQLVLVLRSGSLLAGLIVDEILGLEPYEPEALQPLGGAPSASLDALALGLSRRPAGLYQEEREIVVLDTERLLQDLRLLTDTSASARSRSEVPRGSRAGEGL